MSNCRFLTQSLIFLSLFFLKCLSSDFKNIKIKEEANTNIINKAIVIKTNDFDTESIVYTPMIGVKVYNNFPIFNDEMNNIKSDLLLFSSSYKLNDDKTVIINLPKGNYFAKIQIIDTRIYPFITTVHSDINIYFGYYPNKKAEYIKFENDECVILESRSLEIQDKIVCPLLKINEKENLELLFFQKEMKLSGGATGFPWVLAILLSIQTVSPGGLIFPIIMGPIGFEKKITNPFGNLRTMPIE
jgi:hypothetical protein